MTQEATSAPIHVIYIAGNGRSGSTLLDRVLGQLPGVTSLGETRFLWEHGFVRNNLCECGAPFRECEFWSHVTREAFGSVDEERARRLARESRQLLWTPAIPRVRGRFTTAASRRQRAEHLELCSKLYRALAKRSGNSWLIDSSKLASYALLLTQLPDVQLHVVHLIRDSRAVAFSWKRTRRKPEVTAEEAYMPVRPAYLTALRWNLHNLLGRSLARSSRSYVRVRYEDFVHDPGQTVATIAASVGLEQVDRAPLANGTVRIERGHTVAGNPFRFQNGSVQLKLDDEWRRSMPRASRGLVTLLTLPQLVAYGYSREGGRR